jgi:hypothetical protein
MSEPAIFPARRRAVAALGAALLLTGLGLSGCGVVSAVNKIQNTVQGNKGIIDTFTGRLSATKGTPFEATYVTTGGSSATVVYAARPPDQLAFMFTPSGSASAGGLGRTDVVVNASGEYSCTVIPGPGSHWTCQKSTAAASKIVGIYTPSHWVTFLQDFSLAAGFAGDKITRSTMTVNGFHLDCVDFRAGGVAGTSTICSTSQGILGYVKVATYATSFQIKAYSASPPASVFALPKGAKITGGKRHK